MKRFSSIFLAMVAATLMLGGGTAFAVLPAIQCGEGGVLIGCEDSTTTITTPDAGGFGEIIGATVSIIITIFAVVAVIFVVKGGITLIFSLGNEDRRKTAINTVIYALIGLLVAMFAYAIVSVVSGIRLF